jgi:hypothetical protein
MSRLTLGAVLLLASLALLTSCYASSASRQSARIVRKGFDFDERGPWILVSGPGSLFVAGANFLVASVIPIGSGVDPREPDVKWFHSYPGEMLPGEEIAILCHRGNATWVTGIRPAAGGAWQKARHERWHFPACIEVLPGSYDIEVHYFAREADKDIETSVSRQAESTRPSTIRWQAEAGRVYLLRAFVGTPEPAQGQPPQRHIPRSRALGTTWWELEESDWYVRIEPVAEWTSLEGPIVEQRRAWMKYEERRR